MKSIQDLLKQASSHIDLLEASLILAFVLQKTRTYLHTFPEATVTSLQEKQFLDLFDRRKQGEPIAYLLSEKEFWSLPLRVTQDVLIPRPETELLVELILNHYGEPTDLSVLDLGTGSGAIALALASEKKNWEITAVDQSEAALQVAMRNAERLNLSQIHFQQSDWLSTVVGFFDVIVSNPPYIERHDPHLEKGDLRFEPRTALVADQKGLANFIKISVEAPRFLKQGGALFFEHGYDQAEAVAEILKAEGFTNIQSFKDLQGHDRVTRGIYKQ